MRPQQAQTNCRPSHKEASSNRIKSSSETCSFTSRTMRPQSVPRGQTISSPARAITMSGAPSACVQRTSSSRTRWRRKRRGPWRPVATVFWRAAMQEAWKRVASPRTSASEPALRVASARPERSGEPVSTCGGRFGARLPVRAGRSGRCAGLTSPPGAGWGEWNIASVFRCRGDRAALHHCRGPPRIRRTGTRRRTRSTAWS